MDPDNINVANAVEQVLVHTLIEAINAATATMQQIMVNMTAAALPPVVPVAPVPPGPPAAGPFLRTPLMSGNATIVDLNHKDNQKFYTLATKSLFDAGSKFDVEPVNFQTFINLLHVRARDLGMLEPGQNMLVPPDPTNPTVGTPINSIVDYGRTTLDQIKAWENTFIGGVNRNSQNSKMMYDLIMNSLSIQGLQRVQVWKAQYQVNSQDSGGCLLKVIIRESYLDSNATISTLRSNISSLDNYIRDNGSDLVAFNAYVQSQIDGLSARGQITHDLTVNLFKAYAVVPDQLFRDYVNNIGNQHDDGTNEITAPDLMQRTVAFYKKALQRKEWEQPSAQQKEVLALQAKINSMQKKSDKRVKTVKFAKKTSNVVTPNKKKDKQKGQTRPDWLVNNTPPQDTTSKKHRLWNETKWWWCAKSTGGKCDGKWRRHPAKECKGYAAKVTSNDAASGSKRKAKALKIVTANCALAEESEAEDECMNEECEEEDGEESDYE